MAEQVGKILPARPKITCSRCCQGIPQRGGHEAVVRLGGMLGCCCGFRVIKCHKQNFWVFLSENPRFKEKLRVA